VASDMTETLLVRLLAVRIHDAWSPTEPSLVHAEAADLVDWERAARAVVYLLREREGEGG
jgi:hypothetical protein